MSPKKRPSCPETLAWKINIRLMERIRLTSWSGKYRGGFCTIQTVVGLGISEPSTVSIIFNHFFSNIQAEMGSWFSAPNPKVALVTMTTAWGIARTRTLKREGGQRWWKIEGAFLKYLRCLFYFCSILEANMCVGGSHSSQHEDDNLTWGFLDRKLGEAIQCEGGLEQQDMPCRGSLSDESPMNIRRFFRQTGVFWWVSFWG